MNDAERIRKVRALAEHGATEGERAAARAALDRLSARRDDQHSPPPHTPPPRVVTSPHFDVRKSPLYVGDLETRVAWMMRRAWAG